MIVMKFGGASLGSLPNLQSVLEQIDAAVARERVVVIVSAIGRTTDLLVDDTLGPLTKVDAVIAEHEHALTLLTLPERERVLARLASLQTRLQDGTQAEIHAFGEEISSDIVATLLRARGRSARDLGLDHVVVDPTTAQVDARRTLEALRVGGLDDAGFEVLVVGGFAGRDRAGRLHLLGRGGSDYSATAVGAAIAARVVELWKDVEGIFDLDPNEHPHARPIRWMSWQEADVLAHSGTQVLHPRTIEPAWQARIPIHVRYTRAPWTPGTRIDATPSRVEPDAPRPIVVFGATGGVGSALLELLAQGPLAGRVGWIADSRAAVRPRDHEDLAAAGERLREHGPVARRHREELLDQLARPGGAPLVMVDATASEQIAALGVAALAAGHSVVTANKIAPSGELAAWRAIDAARREGRYAFETTVGAALPVLRTVDTVLAAGDELRRVEAALSGSVNAILGALCAGEGFLDAVDRAHLEGLTEPDPILDLRGGDVRRKLVILLRAAGIEIEQDDVEVQGLAREHDTLDDLPRLAERWETRARDAAARGLALALLARWEPGSARVEVVEVDASDPLVAGRGPGNAVRLLTRDLPGLPITVTGAGAGTTWTAAGLHRELLDRVGSGSAAAAMRMVA